LQKGLLSNKPSNRFNNLFHELAFVVFDAILFKSFSHLVSKLISNIPSASDHLKCECYQMWQEIDKHHFLCLTIIFNDWQLIVFQRYLQSF